ncbi:MAG: hypothetical protein IT204_03460 [Fimbriimonadaceae bacterium]|nr:hypothetical protein [Fimbriimonadaceae bacterium]
MRKRRVLWLLLWLGAAPAAVFRTNGLVLTLDDQGAVSELLATDRPVRLLGAGGLSLDDLSAPEIETETLEVDAVWPDDDDTAFHGPLWLRGQGWTDGDPTPAGARTLTCAVPPDGSTDSLRLLLPARAETVYRVRLPLLLSSWRGHLRLAAVPVDGLGRATGRWQPAEPFEPVEGAWQTATLVLSPPAATSWWQLWLSADGAAGRLTVGPAELQSITGARPLALATSCVGGAQEAVWHGTAAGLEAAATIGVTAGGIRIRATVTARDDQPRALRLRFTLPIEATGWDWWHDPDRADPISGTGIYGDWAALGGGLLYSPYPLGVLSRDAPAQGVALAAPPGQLALLRTSYRSKRGLSLSADLALLPAAGRRVASVEFAVLPVDPVWGFRSALEAWYRHWPEQFASSAAPGAWVSGLSSDAVPDPQALGLLYDEQASAHLSWARERELQALALWQPWGRRWGGPATPPQPVDGRAAPRQTVDGEPFEPWVTDPGLGARAPAAHLRTVLAGLLSGADGQPLNGVVLDGLGAAWAGWQLEDTTAAHLRDGLAPLTVSGLTRQPVGYTAFQHATFLDDLATRLHRDQRLLLGGLSVDAALPWLVPRLDVLGAGEHQPPVGHLQWLRAMAPRKPLSWLDPGLLDPTQLPSEQRRRWQQALVYAGFPGAAGWLSRRLVDAQTPYFAAYVPLLRELHKVGWEPVPHAFSSDPAVRVERYGYRDELRLVVQNSSTTTRNLVLTLDPQRLGLVTASDDGTIERRLLFINQLSRSQRLIEFKVALDRWQANLSVPAEAVLVLSPQVAGSLTPFLDLPGLE